MVNRKLNRNNLLMLKNVLCFLNMEFVLVNDFFKIFYPFVKHMIMGGQVWINQAYRYTIQFETNTHSSFVTLKKKRFDGVNWNWMNLNFLSHWYIPTFHPDQFECIPSPLHVRAANVYASWRPPKVNLAFAVIWLTHNHVRLAILWNAASMDHLWINPSSYSAVGYLSLAICGNDRIQRFSLTQWNKSPTTENNCNRIFVYPITKKSGRCVSISAFFSNPSNMWTGKFSGNFELTFHVKIWNLFRCGKSKKKISIEIFPKC